MKIKLLRKLRKKAIEEVYVIPPKPCEYSYKIYNQGYYHASMWVNTENDLDEIKSRVRLLRIEYILWLINRMRDREQDKQWRTRCKKEIKQINKDIL